MLTRVKQTGRKIEGTEGVEETLNAAEFAGNFKESAYTSDITEYERELQRATLTPQPVLKGHRTGKRSFMEELVGGTASAAAPWHTDLRAMGFATFGLKVISLDTVTQGPFRVGQRIGNNATEGSATVTGVVVKQIAGSPVRLVYRPLVGAFNDTHTIYNYGVSPQASAPVLSASSPANAGFGFVPLSEADGVLPPSATVEERFGGYRYTIIGARATGGLSLRMSEPALLRCEYQGAPVYDSANPGRPRTGAVVTGIQAFATAPRVVKGIPLELRDGSTAYTPILTELPIELNNTLAPRATIANNDLADSGYLATRITGRRLTANLDPEKVVAGTFDYDALMNLGRPFSLSAEVGAFNDANGLLVLHAPAVQPTGSLQHGDRDGQVTQPHEVLFTGDMDDELQVYHVFA